MEKKTKNQGEEFLQKRKHKTLWKKIVSFLACVVVFCTTYALILPAITMEKQAFCGIEEHVHDETCYETQLICKISTGSEDTVISDSDSTTVEKHEHTDECYTVDSILICDLEETEGHVHTDACIERNKECVCGLEESEGHTHDDSCKNEAGEIICGKDETEGHQHTESCYEETESIVCGKEETEAHTHSSSCYETKEILNCEIETAADENETSDDTESTDETAHVHDESCYEEVLICETEEHEHELICYSDKSADVETAEDWEATLPSELTGVWADDVIAVATSQLGYTESTKNYEVDDNDEIKGYTRYGQWYGNPYGDWCAMFASFCYHYAGVDETAMPQEASCQSWVEKLSGNEYQLYYPAGHEEYEPAVGDLIFFDNQHDGTANHVGMIAEVDAEAGTIKTIEGNSSDKVQYVTYSVNDSSIMGYGMLMMNPDTLDLEATTYEEANQITVSSDLADYITNVTNSDISYENQKYYMKLTLEFSISQESIAAQKEYVYTLPDGVTLSQDLINTTNNNPIAVTDDSGNTIYTYKYTSQSTITVTVAEDYEGDVTNKITFTTELDASLLNTQIQFTANISSDTLRLAAGTVGSSVLMYNETKDAFTKDSTYAKYYNEDSPLGVAGSFHIVAFDTATLKTHTNGNILANNLNAGANFGTNNYSDELSYIVHYLTVSSTSASKSEHLLVLGSENVLIGGDSINIKTEYGETKIGTPTYILKDVDSTNTPFIDLKKVEEEMNGISDKLKNMTANGTITTVDQNTQSYIKLPKPDDVLYCNLVPRDLVGLKDNILQLTGFQSGHDGTIVVNVDCTGESEITLPNAYVYVDGEKQSTAEVIVFTAGKVIWNFCNADGVTINTSSMTGMIIAPGATVDLKSNVNGTIVAEKVIVSAESHRTDFTGDIDEPKDTELNPYIALYKVDGENVSKHLTGAAFKIEKWDASQGVYVTVSENATVDSDGGLLILDKNADGTPKELEYNTAYRLTEITAPEGYILSTVTREFYVPNTDTAKYPFSLPSYTINSYDSGHIIYFKNDKDTETDTTSITIKKQWFDIAGNEISKTSGEISINLWQSVYSDEAFTSKIEDRIYKADITLTGPQWSQTIKELPKYATETINDVERKVYYKYYVKELTVNGYTVAYENNDGIVNGTIIIKNTSQTEDSFVLPETGGIGTDKYILSGLLLMAIAAVLIYIKRKSEEGKRGQT